MMAMRRVAEQEMNDQMKMKTDDVIQKFIGDAQGIDASVLLQTNRS